MSSTAEEPKVTEDSPPEETVAEEGKAAETEQQPASAEPPAPEAKTEQESVATPEEVPAPKKEEVVEDDPEEPDDGVPRVLVTGASGYVATSVIKALLQDGRFRIRGTVRSLKKKGKIQPLRDLVPDAKYPLRLVQADLSNAESWKKAVASCSYVFHIASPFPAANVSITDDDIVPLAVEGVTNVFKACAEAGTVKRVVLTSSIAAISCGPVGSPDKPQDYIYTETDWSPESGCAPYEKSKLKAEQAAWEFVKNLEEDKRFELVAVNPAYIQGPVLSLGSGEASRYLCEGILGGKVPAIPDMYFPLVDIRDVVAAHIAAMEKPEAVGSRYVLVSETVHFKQIVQFIAEEFKSQGYKTPSMSMPKPVLWIFKFFDQQAKTMYPLLGKNVRYNNEKMVGELGVKPYSPKDTIIDTCYSLIELGSIKKTRGYLGHPSTRPPPPAKEEPAEPKPQPESETPAEPKAEPESETPAEPKAEPESETPAEPKAEPESETPAEPKAEPESETPAEPKEEPESETPAAKPEGKEEESKDEPTEGQ